ncbi:hypothetical protein V8G54_005249 [Vigna mungo]|uniref:Uncharacterized protein n=1 Tax=Vigna mungo TaxID=3915 RepID=A0AAQ3PK88_VIGMU
MLLHSFQEGLFWKVSDRTAARPIAPLGSTTTLRTSKHSFIALIISLSSTVIMSSTRSRTTGHVISPRNARRPSAIVSVSGNLIILPAALDWAASSAPLGSAAKIRIAGLTDLAANAIPDIKPPPLMGTTSVSICGACSRISRDMVPWPLNMRPSLYGCIKIAPVFCHTLFATSSLD